MSQYNLDYNLLISVSGELGAETDEFKARYHNSGFTQDAAEAAAFMAGTPAAGETNALADSVHAAQAALHTTVHSLCENLERIVREAQELDNNMAQVLRDHQVGGTQS